MSGVTRFKRCFAIAVGTMVTLALPAAGITFSVRPDGAGDYPTIQDAIDAASPGDVITLTNGTFKGTGNKNLDFGGKAITVQSLSGDPSSCIIDCEGSGRGFWFHSFEGPDSIVDGIMVKGGSANSGTPGGSDGGAVLIQYSDPTLTNCAFYTNAASSQGGAIYGYDSNPTITYCTFQFNSAIHGGALMFYECGAYYYNPEYPILTDCTIASNTARNGGGMACSRSGPDLTDCRFVQNAASVTGSTDGQGAGLYLGYSTPRMTDCTINKNVASNDGGGFYCDHSDPRLFTCLITENGADNGGGFYLYDGSDASLTDCTVTYNEATYWGSPCGGGFYVHLSEPILTRSTIAFNRADDYGGGLHCNVGGNATLLNCKLINNTCDHDGGGMYCSRSNVEFENCLLLGNGAGDEGGGMYCYEPSYGETVATLTNCLFTGNSSSGYGAAIACSSYGQASASDVTLTNCIVWNGGGYQIWAWDDSAVTITYSDIQDGWTGTGNINQDPLFVDAEHGDFHLSFGSPCIDAANNSAITELFDLDEETRRIDDPYTTDTGIGTPPIVDMGPYEFSTNAPQICLAPAEIEFFAVPDSDNPEDQVLSIYNCLGVGTLDWQVSEDTAWLTADPDSGQSTGETDEVTLSVDITGMTRGIYTATVTVSDPDAINNPQTITVTLQITGMLHVDDDATNDPGPGDPDSSDPDEDGSLAHPYDSIQEGIDAANDGDIVQVADGTYTGTGNRELDFGGKAITVRGASGDPAMCIIDCQNQGRGFNFWYNEGSDSIVEAITITNGQVSDSDGGGVYCEYSSPTFNNCVIQDCSAIYGGGFYGMFADATLTNCTITGNTATGEYDTGSGGGVYFAYGDVTLANCLVTNNTADYSGGGVCSEYGNLTATNCTISGNARTVSYGSGAGVFCRSEGLDQTFSDCIIWDNLPDSIYDDSGYTTVSYSDVQGGWTGSGTDNIDANPLFVAGPLGCHYLSQTASGFPADSPCVDAGSDTAANLEMDILTTRRDRFADTGVVDMGFHYPITNQVFQHGDFDRDGDVDSDDYADWFTTMTGPCSSGACSPPLYGDSCGSIADFDNDGDVDLVDFSLFQQQFTIPQP